MDKVKEKNDRMRYNIITIFVYIIGIVLLAQLFNLQIIHGVEYRETSNTKLTRESTLEADRGNIRDSSGTIMAGVESQYSVVLYKTKQSPQYMHLFLLHMHKLL